MKIIKITNQNIYYLENFLNKLVDGKQQFRYYNTRSLNIISNHVATLILQDKNKLVCYGHLDFDGDKTWLGICTADDSKGKGYGLRMMNELINVVKQKKLKVIYLTVDNDNKIAQHLYKKLGFKPDKNYDLFTRYKFTL